MSEFKQIPGIILKDEPLIQASGKRGRGNTACTSSRSNSQSQSPTRAKQAKKRVRFSDAELFGSGSASSGIQRKSLTATSSKRQNFTLATIPSNPSIKYNPRTQRILERNKQRTIIESNKKEKAKQQESEVERLREAMVAQDVEAQIWGGVQDTASQIEEKSVLSLSISSTQSIKIQELEQEILDLKAELRQKEIKSIEQDPDYSEKAPPKTQLEFLNSEISRLTLALEFNAVNYTRLRSKLSQFLPADEADTYNHDHDHISLDQAFDSILAQLALSQSQLLEKSHAFSALSAQIISLGFSSPSTSPDEALRLIAGQFWKVKLDLGYLAPGKTVKENNELLDILVKRILVLTKEIERQNKSIDEYHAQDISLRKQLNTYFELTKHLQEVKEKETSNSHLQTALEGEEGKDIIISELERRLTATLTAAAEVQSQVNELSSTIDDKDQMIEELKSNSLERDRQDNDALALLDVRVSVLSIEAEKVNIALKKAHSIIIELRRVSEELGAQVESGKKQGALILIAIKETIRVVSNIADKYIDSSVFVQRPCGQSLIATDEKISRGMIRSGGFFNGKLARKGRNANRMEMLKEGEDEDEEEEEEEDEEEDKGEEEDEDKGVDAIRDA